MRKSIALLLVLTVVTIASAGSVNTPNTFVAGTKAKASEVNANFTAVETAVNDNNTRITSNSTSIGSNSSNIANNTSGISANSSSITVNSSNITTNTSNISTNGTDIANLANRSWEKSGNDLSYNNGNVGIGTTTPNAKVQIVAPRITGTDYGLLMSSADNGGFSVADINYVNETTGTWWHTTLRPSSGGGSLEWHGRTSFDPTSPAVVPLSLTLNGNVGIGTTTPDRGKLQIRNVITNQYGISIASSNGSDGFGRGLEVVTPDFDFSTTGTALSVAFGANSGNTYVELESRQNGKSSDGILVLQRQGGNVGIGTVTPQGRLDVNGTIFQRGGVLHADYVFDPAYELESIEEHSKYMWNERHLKAVPKAKTDENGYEILEVGEHRRGILEELEKAHIYIEQLHKHMKVMEERLAKLERNPSNQELRAEISQ